eukprot:gene37498-24322_t
MDELRDALISPHNALMPRADTAPWGNPSPLVRRRRG